MNLEKAIEIVSIAANSAIEKSEESILDLDFLPEEIHDMFQEKLQEEINYWTDIRDHLKERLLLFNNNIKEEEEEDPEISALKNMLKEKDEEIKNLQNKLDESEDKKSSLVLKNISLENKVDFLENKESNKNILQSNIKEFYVGEVQDFLLNILKQTLERCKPDSRAYEITEDLLKSNSYIGNGDNIIKQITSIFDVGNSKKGTLTDSEIKQLEHIGFFNCGQNGHLKLKFNNSDKYMFMISSSSSDKNSNKAKVREIKRCIACTQKI